MEKISPGRHTREFFEETVEPYSRFLNCALCGDWLVMKNAFRSYRYLSSNAPQIIANRNHGIVQ